MLSRKTEFEFVRPYDLIPKYLPAVAEKAQEGRAFCEARPAPATKCGINSGGASEQQNNPDFEKSLSWSGCADLNRGPHRPERCALPDCATLRYYKLIITSNIDKIYSDWALVVQWTRLG